MIMKCHGRFSECYQRCSQRSTKEVCQTEHLKVFGGAKKPVKNNVSYGTVNGIYGDRVFQNSLLKILNNNSITTYAKLMEYIKTSISASNKGNPGGLRFKILYTSIYRELDNVPNKDAKIDYGVVKGMLINSFNRIISELLKEQTCINKYMEDFKELFKGIDFAKLSEDFLKSSSRNKIDMLTKYCELVIILGKYEIVTDEFNFKWFARNLIDSLPKNFHEKSEDELYNDDDDDALLAYYVNELKGK